MDSYGDFLQTCTIFQGHRRGDRKSWRKTKVTAQEDWDRRLNDFTERQGHRVEAGWMSAV